ncbi:MAG: hypothetical protein WC685_00210 [Methylobacter sp.]|jgi:hypothetical protein
MKKIILISAVTLFSTGAYAAGCDESSLKGRYGYEVIGVNTFPVPVLGTVTRSTHVVGQANFNGKGDFTIVGFGSAAGHSAERKGNGTYTVDPATCTATGMLTWDLPTSAPASTPAETSEFYIVLDHTDNRNARADTKAYHASVLVTTAAPYSASASGSLTRFNGKFN